MEKIDNKQQQMLKSQQSTDYSALDIRIKKKNSCSQKKYFCSYDEGNYKCGCEPQTILIKEPECKKFNVLFIAKIGDPEVYVRSYQMMQIFKSKTEHFIFYGSDLLVKEIKKINASPQVSYCEELKKLNKLQDEDLIQFDQQNHELVINLLVTIGGDGTILYGMRFFQNCQPPPLMCFEKGTLGFMAMNNLEHMISDISYVCSHIKNQSEMECEQKMRLQGVLQSKSNTKCEHTFEYHALNEFVLERGGYSSILKIDIFVNDIFLTQFWGDGLIVSTPTGSTAYNLSAGGPIIQNQVESITLTPICPFSLSFRPLVLPKCSKVKLVLADDSRGHGQVNADGQQTSEFKQCDELIINQSLFSLTQVRSSENFFEDYVDKLRRLLNWNNTSFTKEKLQKISSNNN